MKSKDLLEKHSEYIEKYTSDKGVPYVITLPREVNLGANSSLVSIACPTHKEEFDKTAKYLVRALKTGSRLACCLPQGKGFTLASLKDKALSLGVLHKDYSYRPEHVKEIYLGTDRLVVTCKVHGTTNARKINDFLLRSSAKGLLKCCSDEGQCRSKSEWLHSITHDKLSESGEPYDYSSLSGLRSIASTDRISVVCPMHGPKDVYAFSHLTNKLSCCRFSETGKRATKEYLLEGMRKAEPQHDYEIEMGPNFIESKIWVICKKHGKSLVEDLHIKRVPAVLFKRGNYCKYCTRLYHSGAEQKMVALLQRNFGEDLRIITNKHLKGHGQKRLDIYLPEYRLGIEINGVYWHSEDKKGRLAHVEKRRILASKNVVLLQFTDLELDQKPDLIVSMIRSRMGKNKHVLYARSKKLTIDQEVDPKEAREFFNANHISGFIPATYYYGARINGKLVSLASFGKPRFNKEADWELLRFATLRNCTLVGGLGKLVKDFLKDCEAGTKLISYADLRYGTGNAYEKSGFVKVRENPPSFGYFKALKYVSRYQVQRKNLPKLLGDNYDPSLSSNENMEANNWRRIYDAGNILFVKEKK